MPYERRELWLLIAVAAVFLVGLGVREWRAGFPDVAERIERFDRDEPIDPLPPISPREPRAPRRPARRADAGEETAQLAPGARHRQDEARAPRGAEARATRPDRAPVVAPSETPDPRLLDLNAASLEQIARLPGVGASLARRIVEERDRRGRFDSAEALRGVVGLGPKKLAALRDLVTVAEATAAD